jgi:osmotically-inducible protein OsmY
MEQSAALTALPADKHRGDGKNTPTQMAPLVSDIMEDSHLGRHVECALDATGYWPLRDVDVTVQARVVTLAGRVPSYYLKQVAQAAALGVPGIDRVCNELVVA